MICSQDDELEALCSGLKKDVLQDILLESTEPLKPDVEQQAASPRTSKRKLTGSPSTDCAREDEGFRAKFIRLAADVVNHNKARLEETRLASTARRLAEDARTKHNMFMQRVAEEMDASKKQREEAKTLADLQSAKLAELERQQSLHSPLGVLNNNSLNQQPPGLSMGSVSIPPGTANLLPTSGNMG